MSLKKIVHDSLTARAVVFENNGKKVVLVSCDPGSFENDVFSTMQKSIFEKFGLMNPNYSLPLSILTVR